jgi:hypothetical protein
MLVVLVLPRELPWLASLPFELLCDEEGFLFYRGHMLTRTLRGLDGKAVTVRPGMSALVAWANPREDSLEPVPEEDLLRHEQALQSAAREFGWETLPALRSLTKSSLPERLRKALPDTVPTELRKEWILGSMKTVGGWLQVLNANLGKQGAGQVMAEASREATNLAALFESVEKELCERVAQWLRGKPGRRTRWKVWATCT